MNVFRNTCREIEYQIANRKLQIANHKLIGLPRDDSRTY